MDSMSNLNSKGTVKGNPGAKHFDALLVASTYNFDTIDQDFWDGLLVWMGSAVHIFVQRVAPCIGPQNLIPFFRHNP